MINLYMVNQKKKKKINAILFLNIKYLFINYNILIKIPIEIYLCHNFL